MNDVSQVVLVYPLPRMSFDRSNQLVAKALWVCLTERILFLINCELRNVYSTSLKPMRACALFSHSHANNVKMLHETFFDKVTGSHYNNAKMLHETFFDEVTDSNPVRE